jgi:hypothetical protein
MTYAPAPLAELAAYWTAQGGVSLGIVGNAAHTAGYHLGRDRIYDGSGPGLGDSDYSVKLARDRAGLTNAASAIDLGKLDGSLGELRAFSRWLVKHCTESAAARHDVREIIYSPDGVKVQRWSGVDNAIHSGAGNGDDSHLTHTHISFYRDSEHRSKVELFAPYFAEDAPMPTLTSYIPGQVATIKPTANIRTAPKLSATIIRVVDATPDEWIVTGWVKGDTDPDGGSDQWLTRWASGRWEYTAKSNVSAGPAVPVPPARTYAVVVGGKAAGSVALP